MSFASEILKPVSHKITLVEIDIPIVSDYLINAEAGIWRYNLTPGVVEVEGSDDLTGYYENQNIVVYRVASVLVDVNTYIEVDSLADLRLQQQAFYFDMANNKVYIHFVESDWQLDRVVRISAIEGYSDQVDSVNGAYYSDIYYEPRIMGLPALTKKKDPLFFGLLKFQSMTIGFNNADGHFDGFKDRDIWGQPVRVKYGFEGFAFDDFETLFSGFIDDFGYDWENFSLVLQDKRKNFTKKIPIRFYSRDDNPDLNDENVGKPIALAYGVIKKAPAICTDQENVAPADYSFKFMDTTDHAAQAITQVYVDNVKVSTVSTDLNNGEFVLALVDYEPGQEVLVDFTGASANALDVIVDILDIYGGFEFLSANYNINEWNQEQAIAPDVGLYIGKLTMIKKLIEECCVGADGVFNVTDDGHFSFRSYNEEREISKVISDDEWLDMPKTKLKGDEFLSSVDIGYARNEKTNVYRSARNTDFEDEVVDIYRTEREKEIKTILTNETDAQAKGDKVMAISKQVNPVVTRKTKVQNMLLNFMDFIVASHKRLSEDADQKVYELLGVTKDTKNAEVILEMRFVRDYVAPVFLAQQEFIFNDKIHIEKIW